MNMYRIETMNGGHDYAEIVDNENGTWVYAEDAMEAIGNLKAELSLARETIEEFKRLSALESIGDPPANRQIKISMSNREYDRMRKALGREWEWHDVIINVPAGGVR